MKHLKHLVALAALVLSGLTAHAGAYDDFFHALRIDNAAGVRQWLLRGFDPNTVYEDGTPALIKALQLQSYAAAQEIANHPDAHIDARNAQDETALMLAALRGQQALVISLVSKGAEVNKDGWTPMHYAATGGHTRICAFLLGARAEVDSPGPNGTTPLMMAAMYGNAETVRFLLESGADVHAHNSNGLSPEDFALRASRPDSLLMIRTVLERRKAQSQ